MKKDHPLHKRFMRRLREARLIAGYTQREVADYIGKNSSYVSKIENCKIDLDMFILFRMNELFKKPISYYFESQSKRTKRIKKES
ncbi:helix-turn-helix domain-containing protein [Leptospira sarikeiensis]|uniref:XRE family transcriptional regulator n=1 Tax=Leptospira sarikeiensis TaxID=2484943 RepID=A0A4R9K4S1_9LEPT|nr:helix-turn-helix transcriptional regulator [Leptospira sarikeiensis]TGL61163.1 XRE family transcriptional regulator [Leptospira sarikeiensis]